jgi:hypothetical protein
VEKEESQKDLPPTSDADSLPIEDKSEKTSLYPLRFREESPTPRDASAVSASLAA